MLNNRQSGEVNSLLIATIFLGLLVVGLAGFGIWAFTNYHDQKANVDQKISVAVSAAKKQQAATDAKSFAEKEKSPLRSFMAPADFGSIKFSYPKTWSVYVATQNSSSYEVYFQPSVVQPTSSDTLSALRLSVKNRSYEQSLNSFQTYIKRGDLKASAISNSGVSGVRLSGTFSDDIKGETVILKLREKSILLSAEAPKYVKDFNDIILKSLSFSP